MRKDPEPFPKAWRMLPSTVPPTNAHLTSSYLSSTYILYPLHRSHTPTHHGIRSYTQLLDAAQYRNPKPSPR